MINIGCSWFLADTADLITLGWSQTAYFSSFASLQWIGGCCGGLWAPSCSQHEKLQGTCSLCAAHTLTRSQSNIGRVPHIQRLDGINVSGWIIDKVMERCKSNRTTRSHKHTHSESQPAQKFCGHTSLLSLSLLHFPSVCCFFHFCIMVLCFFFYPHPTDSYCLLLVYGFLCRREVTAVQQTATQRNGRRCARRNQNKVYISPVSQSATLTTGKMCGQAFSNLSCYLNWSENRQKCMVPK